jgi:hypothetical protein
MMIAMITVAVLGGAFLFIAAAISRQSIDPMYDPDDSTQHSSSQLEMTYDLWKSMQPVDDTDAPPAPDFKPYHPTPKPPRIQSQTEPPKPTPTTNP